ncbi:MAG: hypothetical protein V3T20_01545 [Gemmatimonadota bacterium]
MTDSLTRIERLVYERVKNNRHLKVFLRDALQGLCDLRGPVKSESAYPIEAREGYFFGFHDKCPWSADGTMLLAHRYPFDLRRPGPEDRVEVGFFAAPDFREFVPVGETCAWNWHQGAMLQWVGGSSDILYNDCATERHIARVVDRDGRPKGTLSIPVCAVSPDGSTALGYCFARLRASPYGYGYANGRDPNEKDLCPGGCGIEAIDIASGERRTVITLAELAELSPEPTMSGAFHYVTHCQFSPSGQRFLAFHCWLYDGHRVGLRMFTCSSDSGDVHLFRTSGMVSHAAWRDDEWILAYARTESGGDGYYLCPDRRDEFWRVAEKDLVSDGHPSFSPDGNWILTDTYPDRYRRRRLLLYDLESRRAHTLASLYSPKQFSRRRFSGMLRCDLHPRWDRSGKTICFDSTHTGKRALCTLDIGDAGHSGGGDGVHGKFSMSPDTGGSHAT